MIQIILNHELSSHISLAIICTYIIKLCQYKIGFIFKNYSFEKSKNIVRFQEKQDKNAKHI
jgi:hypothetical protein